MTHQILTFEEWYEINKEALTTTNFKSALRQAFTAGELSAFLEVED